MIFSPRSYNLYQTHTSRRAQRPLCIHCGSRSADSQLFRKVLDELFKNVFSVATLVIGLNHPPSPSPFRFRMFVLSKDLATNTLVCVPGSYVILNLYAHFASLSCFNHAYFCRNNPKLFSRTLTARSWNWIWGLATPAVDERGIRVRAQTRYRMEDVGAVVRR